MLKIIISPAKKMNIENDVFAPRTIPAFRSDAETIMHHLKSMTPAELKALWKCNDQILQLNVDRLKTMDLTRNLSPAILTYEGLQYQSMAPFIFEESQWKYIESHLYILSGFYGLLRPFDGIVPYRLEMQARLKIDNHTDLYSFWGNRLYRRLVSAVAEGEDEATVASDTVIVNLASKEYSKAIEPWLMKDQKAGSSVNMITCFFESELPDGARKIKATEAKMARGEMVRYLASIGSEDPEVMKNFTGQGYHFDERSSTATDYVFVKPY